MMSKQFFYEFLGHFSRLFILHLFVAVEECSSVKIRSDCLKVLCIYGGSYLHSCRDCVFCLSHIGDSWLRAYQGAS